MRIITSKMLDDYEKYLINEEKSSATRQKYLHDITEFRLWLNNQELTKNYVLLYKSHIADKYAVASANSIISSFNGFFSFMNWNELKVKSIKVQK